MIKKANLYTYTTNSTSFTSYLTDNSSDPIYDTNTGNIWLAGEKFGNTPVFQSQTTTEYSNLPVTYNFDVFSNIIGNKFIKTAADNKTLPKYNTILGYGNAIYEGTPSSTGNNFNVVIGSTWTNGTITINGDIGTANKNSSISYRNIFANALNEFRSPIQANDIQTTKLSVEELNVGSLKTNVSDSYVSSLGSGATLDIILKLLLTASDYNKLPEKGPSVTVEFYNGSTKVDNYTVESYTNFTYSSLTAKISSVNWNEGTVSKYNPRWLYAVDNSNNFTNINASDVKDAGQFRASTLSTEGNYFWAVGGNNTYTAINYNNSTYTQVVPNSSGVCYMLKPNIKVCKCIWCGVTPDEYLSGSTATLYATSKTLTTTTDKTWSGGTTNAVITFANDMSGTYKNGQVSFNKVSNVTVAPGAKTILSVNGGTKPSAFNTSDKNNGGFQMGSLLTFYKDLAANGVLVPDTGKYKIGGTAVTKTQSGTLTVTGGFKYMWGWLSCGGETDDNWNTLFNNVNNACNNNYTDLGNFLKIAGITTYYSAGSGLFYTNVDKSLQTVAFSSFSGDNKYASGKYNGLYFIYPADKVNFYEFKSKGDISSTTSIIKNSKASAGSFGIYTADGTDVNKGLLGKKYANKFKMKIGDSSTYYDYVIFITGQPSYFSGTSGKFYYYYERTVTGNYT